MTGSSSEVDVRAERVRVLSLARIAAIATAALLVGTVGRQFVDPQAWGLLAITATSLVVLHLAVLLVPRRNVALLVAVEVTMIADLAGAVVLAAVTGGTGSPFVPLLLLEVFAVLLTLGRWAAARAGLLATLAIGWLWSTEPSVVVPGVIAFDEHPTVEALVALALVWVTVVFGGWLADASERDLRRRTEELALLHDVTPDLDPRLGPVRIAEVLARLLRDELGYRRAALWGAATGGYEALAVASDDLAVQAPGGIDLGALEDPLSRAIGIDGVWPVRHDDPKPAALTAVFGAEAPLLLVPLRIDRRVIGLLVVEVRKRFARPPVARRRDLRLLRMLADQAALLLDNARIQRELADKAITDAVTGVPNHRFMQERLREELERLTRRAGKGEDRRLSFALLDLDHFKRVNDTYGHPAGDRVLAAVAGTAVRTLRTSDIVCRYGGEEFAAILPDTSAVEAIRACERLREAVAALGVETREGVTIPRVTASFGVVTVEGTPPPAEDLIARADAALYAAKAGGRDRVVHADGVTLGAHPTDRVS